MTDGQSLENPPEFCATKKNASELKPMIYPTVVLATAFTELNAKHRLRRANISSHNENANATMEQRRDNDEERLQEHSLTSKQCGNHAVQDSGYNA